MKSKHKTRAFGRDDEEYLAVSESAHSILHEYGGLEEFKCLRHNHDVADALEYVCPGDFKANRKRAV